MRTTSSIVLGLFTILLPVAGCSASASGGGSVTFSPAAGCQTDSTVNCSVGDGYSCSGSTTPDSSDPTIVCSDGVADSSDMTLTDFCCITAALPSGTCSEDDSLTCPDPGSFGISCATGDNPMTYDSTLTCSAPAGDDSGDHFCCVP